MKREWEAKSTTDCLDDMSDLELAGSTAHDQRILEEDLDGLYSRDEIKERLQNKINECTIRMFNHYVTIK